MRVRHAVAIALVALLARGASAQSTAESDYVLQCRGCHGPDGAGVPGLVPSLANVAALLETLEGRARLLSVPGVRQASLSDARLAALLNWVGVTLSRPAALPTVEPISPEEVARYRAM